ncbi:MAG: ribosomal protein S18-alanine N-acetyltransferase [Pseudomonadota bacterium]
MTPDDMARLHAAAFDTERPWSSDEFAALCARATTSVAHAAQGFALWRATAGEAELLTIAVHPAHQGRGLGQALMRDWMADAAHQADIAFLEVAADNAAACALYAKCGFDEVARRTDYYTRAGGKADALILRAALDRPAP